MGERLTPSTWSGTVGFPNTGTYCDRNYYLGGSPLKKTLAAALTLGVSVAIPLSAAPADASHQDRDRTYSSCKSLNRDFTHGVGARGAVDKTSGMRVRNFTRNTRVYRLNNGPRTEGAPVGKGQYDLDRDNDGIACEKA